jgi:tRNA threonylcarbamoyladenosine biosynthesis protein TsaB
MSATLLVLDTASETLHLGLAHAGREAVRALPGGAQSSAALLPALKALLEEAGLHWKQLQAIGVGVGPGAFTGVRGACAVAQGLAFGAGLAVLRIDTLMAVAEAARQAGAGNDIQVAIDARMGEAYGARYRHDASRGGWQVVAPPALHDPAVLAARLIAEGGTAQVAGSSLLAHASAWTALDRPAWPQAIAHGAALLALARAAWSRGEAVDAAEAQPLYVRDKVAQTTQERTQERTAARTPSTP